MFHPISWIITFVLFSFHQELIFHAFELRPYSLLIALSLSSFYILNDVFNRPRLVFKGQLAWYWLALILSICYHPYGFIMICCIGFFFVLRDWRTENFLKRLLERKIFWLSLAFLGTWLWLYYLKGTIDNPLPAVVAKTIDVFQFIPNPLENPRVFLRSVVGNLLGCKYLAPLLLGPIISIFWPKESRKEMLLGFLMLVVMPILLILISDSMSGYWFIQRQFIWVMSLFTLLIGLSWDKILRKTL